MRTTLTLEPDVENFVRNACHRTRKSFKQVVNEALRSALKPAGEKPELHSPRPMGGATGIDPRRLQEFADEMEADACVEIQRRHRNTPSQATS